MALFHETEDPDEVHDAKRQARQGANKARRDIREIQDDDKVSTESVARIPRDHVHPFDVGNQNHRKPEAILNINNDGPNLMC